VKSKEAVPTGWPCCETMKLPDWALAGAEFKASNAARQRKAKLRKVFVHPSCWIRHGNGERVVGKAVDSEQ